MRRMMKILVVALALAAVTGLSVACGGDDDGRMDGMMGNGSPAGAIRVGLVNWAVEPAQSSARAGEITFWAVHDMEHRHGAGEGGDVHDLQVLRKAVDGSVELVGQVQGLKMGDAKALTLTLDPGEYELACTVVEVVNGEAIGHYSKGMRTPFTVTA